ncbi:MAG: N-acetylneuraminate synthase [Rhodospirillaceae bacterium]|nr:N-acetylneuraminate synthase [Rhodospirillaceae bacterium]MBT5564728.1 N-acetylneuraminate synthase [Rhodospirillaceae bacterium]MBT7449640.1 N-acetylneuraminate synthase [Rhodospirillaceae bacterium]
MTIARPHTFVIAEAGVNHNGDIARARAMVDVAADAGADAIKFQSFKSEKLATARAPKAAYQVRNTGADDSQAAMLKALELSDDNHRVLFDASAAAGIEFLSTPFDEDSLGLLVRTLNVRRLKIASGELTNAPLLLAMARTGKPVILSTGMARIEDIKEALGVLAFGYTTLAENLNLVPGIPAFTNAYNSESGQAALASQVTLLHCTSNYPATAESINLRAIETLGATFGLPVGLSDHSQGIAIATAAVARGASVIEKHFTLDATLPGPDHTASLEPPALRDMIAAIRCVEVALGTGEKTFGAEEQNTAAVARKSLVATASIAQGEIFTETNLGSRRPGDGIAPIHYWDILGTSADRAYDVDDLIVGEPPAK